MRAPWAKAFKRSIIEKNHIRFTEGIRVGEDALFNIEYIFAANSCRYIHLPEYLHRVHTESISHKLNPEFLSSFEKLQVYLKNTLETNGLFALIQRAYYANALENISFMLIRGIFSPYANNTFVENKALCERILKNKIFKTALEYNGKIGNLMRKIILFLFKKRHFAAVKTLCRLCFFVLDRNDKKFEKLWNKD